MEASVRLITPTSLNRHLRHSLKLPLKLSSRTFVPYPSRNPNPRDSRTAGSSSIHSNPPFPAFEAFLPRSNRGSAPFPSNGFPLSLSISQIFPSCFHQERRDCSILDPKEGFYSWNRAGEAVDGGDLGFCQEEGPIWMVVLLGWLGAEQKHLKRYAEMYRSRGIRSVEFVVPVREVLGFDLGRRVEKRITGLASELVSWCSESEKDGRERRLLFHTFSNTGWLTYGAILENLQSRTDIIQKIKGCVVDSGADPEINPQVWAAGFSAALLKKRSSLTYSSVQSIEGGNLNGKMQDIRSPLTEMVLLLILNKFFTIILKLQDVDQRLSKIISILSKNQPPCPQLYLYSSADKVIPVHSVERFIQEQKVMGRNVRAHNFGSSPHVDHFRSFPHIYSAEVYTFLKECRPVTL